MPNQSIRETKCSNCSRHKMQHCKWPQVATPSRLVNTFSRRLRCHHCTRLIRQFLLRFELPGHPMQLSMVIRCNLKVELPAVERYLDDLNKENLPNAIRALHTDMVSEALGTYTSSIVLGGRPAPINDEARSLPRETRSF